MNLYLLQLVGKILSIGFVTFVSLFNPNIMENKKVDVNNDNKNKNLTIVNKIIQHDTKKTYSSSLPVNTQKIIKQGVDGIVYVGLDGSQTKVVQPVVTEEVIIGTGEQGEFDGMLSGYGPDCYGCSVTGNVACHTKNGGKHSLIYDGEYYQDDEYGKIRILSGARSKFPCGTIVQITKQGSKPYYAVVLDSGASMINAWEQNGIVWFDLAYKTQADARAGNTAGKNIHFSVKRWGW